MKSARLARWSVLLLTLYVTADLTNALMPGVFFFAADDLFVDGAIEPSSNTQQVAPAAAQLPPGDTTTGGDQSVKVGNIVAPPTPRGPCNRRLWKNLRHTNAVAHSSSSSLDPSQSVLS
jgi:hypothetical protein